MRVRHHRRSPATSEPLPGHPRPRLRLVPGDPAPVRDEFHDEHRLRDAGGPDDVATYHCGCGYVFEAPVSTSVRCPHCDAGQAW